MTAGIVGLGLIGGSLAKAYHEAGHEVLAYDRNASVQEFAAMSGVVDGTLDEKSISRCDIVLLAIRPQAAVDYIRQMAEKIGKRPVVIDCCGTKREVFKACAELSREHGFTYLGGHPMAGTHNSGFKYSRANLFSGAPMVIVPQDPNDIELLGRAKQLLAPAGFGKISVTTAKEHDETIAFTSQLAHVVSNAYIKSPTAAAHKGVSAGSYKDMTRVAWLDSDMWAELFMENRDNLIREIDGLVQRLEEYSDALSSGDAETLRRLLEDGRKRKEEVDGR